jgi:hypothetical protein
MLAGSCSICFCVAACLRPRASGRSGFSLFIWGTIIPLRMGAVSSKVEWLYLFQSQYFLGPGSHSPGISHLSSSPCRSAWRFLYFVPAAPRHGTGSWLRDNLANVRPAPRIFTALRSQICKGSLPGSSPILTSQLPMHEQIDDPTIADGILDRLWFTTFIAAKCAPSPCGRNTIRHRTRRRNEPKSKSFCARWRCYASD